MIVDLLQPVFKAIAITSITAASAPTKAPKYDAIIEEGKRTAASKKKRPAPAFVPMTEGAAKGFWSMDYKAAPETASAEPASTALIILGSLI